MSMKVSADKKRAKLKSIAAAETEWFRPQFAHWRSLIFVLLIVVVTVAVFSRLFRQDFVLWDDDIHVYKNPYLNPLTSAHLRYLWQHPYLGMYIPLSYTLFGLVAIIAALPAPNPQVTDSGALLNPHLFHAVNVGIHILNVLLVFAILRVLVQGDLPALAGALLFGLHPLGVESVAWISELRGLSSNFFILTSTWFYLRYALASSKGEIRSYFHWSFVAAIASFILALLCKSTAVVLPLLLFVLGHWCLGRTWRKCLRDISLLLVICIPFALIQMRVQEVKPELITALWLRPLIAGDALAFYLYKLAAPVHMVIDYGRKPSTVLAHWWGYITWIAPAALATLAWYRRRSEPWLLAAILISVIVLLPVLGLLPFAFQYFSTVADRYCYLALLGPALALTSVLKIAKSKLVMLTSGVIVVCFASLSIAQTPYWDNSLTLLGHSLETTWNSDVIQCNYGIALARHGEKELALRHFDESLRINPQNYMAHTNVGNILLLRGQGQQAIVEYQKAIAINPEYAIAHLDLGDALAMQGDFQTAINQFREALRLDPNLESARVALQKALSRSQRESHP